MTQEISSEPGAQLLQLNAGQFERFRKFIYTKSGIRVPDNKVSLLSNRIRRRLRAGDFCDFDAYYRYLTSLKGRGELSHFLDAITTNETFFFRTQPHFDWLSGEFFTSVVAEQRRGTRERRLRIWSAGCANGAEPYSIAICLDENRYRFRDWSMSVLGSDISEEALSDAREGVFRPRAVETIERTRRRRYFTPVEDDRVRVRPELKQLVTFQQHNLMTPMDQPLFDCVFIRNVLIYFDRDSKRKVIANLIHSMAPGGFLVVGPSEGIYDMLEPLERRHLFVYQKPTQSPAGAR